MSSTESDPQLRWQQIQLAFEQALELPTAQRDSLLSSCELDPQALQEVRDMLAAHEGPELAMESGLAADRTPETLGPYQIEKKIGSGGMGEVFLARRSDGSFDRRVAIKTLNGWLVSPAVKSRFLQEQRLHARLEHPNITRLLDAGVTSQGLPYLVTDYVDGHNIVDFVRSRRPSMRQRVALLAQACDAVSFAHSKLVLHRDIKPSNIMVSDAGEVRLLDFGIAKLLSDDSSAPANPTAPGEQLMTLRYASPEQIRGQSLDITCDVYALGVVLFELLTDQVPFNADTQWSISEKILNSPVSFPTNHGTQQKLDPDLRAICLKALEKMPADRYASVREMADDLRRYLNYYSVEARRPGLLSRLRRLLIRHPLAVPLSCLAVLAIVGGGVTAAWQAQRAQVERDLARAQRDRAEQVTQVLVDLFDSDPYAEADSRRDSVTLREFLVSRANNISDELSDQPQLKAQLMNLLANLLANLSLIQEAEPLAVEALAIQSREADGGPTLPMAASLSTLGIIRYLQGQYGEAERLHRRSLEIRQTLLPADDPLVVSSLNDLSVSLNEQPSEQKQQEALLLDQTLLKLNISRYGDRSLQASQSLNNLGALYVERGQPGDQEKAAPLLRQALSIRKEILGEAHPNTATTAANLANLLHDMGRLDEASLLFDQAIEGARETMGPNSLRLADLIYGSGFLLMDQQRWNGASDRFGGALEIYRAALPDNHPYIADGHFALGQAQQKAGMVGLAITNFQNAYEIYRKDPEAADSEFRAAMHVARAQTEQGEEARAVGFIRQILATSSDRVDADVKQEMQTFVDSLDR